MLKESRCRFKEIGKLFCVFTLAKLPEFLRLDILFARRAPLPAPF